MSERFEMRATPEELAQLDAWRAKQRPIPSRSEATRMAWKLLVSPVPTPAEGLHWLKTVMEHPTEFSPATQAEQTAEVRIHHLRGSSMDKGQSAIALEVEIERSKAAP